MVESKERREILTCQQAADRYGHGADFWRRRYAEGHVDGYRGIVLYDEGCLAYLRSLEEGTAPAFGEPGEETIQVPRRLESMAAKVRRLKREGKW